MKMEACFIRTWYTRLFVLFFIGALYFILIRSSDGGIFGFDSSFWGQRKLIAAWTKNDSLPRLLMYHDSFGSPLFGWLALNFRETISIPHYSGGTIWTLNWIEQTDPDVVVIEFAERYLHDLDVLLGE